MRRILQLDEEVFFDSHRDMTDASVWIRLALRPTKQKDQSQRLFSSIFPTKSYLC